MKETELAPIKKPEILEVNEDGNPIQLSAPPGRFAEVMGTLGQLAMVGQLTKIRKGVDRVREYLDDRTSEGWIQNFDNVAVTFAQPSQEFRLDFPAQSISITNNPTVPPALPVPIWVEINRRFNTRRTLNPGETLNINFETHELKRFFVQCPPGLTTTFRATAKG